MAEAPPGQAPSTIPNPTLFINNLNEKLSRPHRLDELKTTLKNLFRPFGEILDIVALSNYHSKGQAFIVFRTPEQAAAGMTKLQGHELLGKKMRQFVEGASSCWELRQGLGEQIAFAKSKSDVLAKMDGTFRVREKKVRPRPPKSGKKDTAMADRDEPVAHKRPRAEARGDSQGAAPSYHAPTAHHQGGGGGQQAAMPHPILFLEGLPPDIAPQNLADLFKPYAGFKEVRMVPSRPGIAFCEFESADFSAIALHRLQGFPMGQFKMTITFSKA